MPSCVVKTCKNNSIVHNKSSGLTFHLFPTKTEIKNRWITAIRLNRGDPQWKPSKASVVCSDHFQDCDLYITKCGLRRITRTGCPKVVINSHIESSLSKSPALAFNSPVKYVNDSRLSPDNDEHSEIDPNPSLTRHSDQPVLPRVDVDKIYPNSDMELPVLHNAIDFCRVVMRNSSANQGSSDGSALDPHESIYEAPVIRQLKHKIMTQKKVLKKKTRIIRTLQQKVVRLTSRNQSLREMIHVLKSKKLM